MPAIPDEFEEVGRGDGGGLGVDERVVVQGVVAEHLLGGGKFERRLLVGQVPEGLLHQQVEALAMRLAQRFHQPCASSSNRLKAQTPTTF